MTTETRRQRFAREQPKRQAKREAHRRKFRKVILRQMRDTFRTISGKVWNY